MENSKPRRSYKKYYSEDDYDTEYDKFDQSYDNNVDMSDSLAPAYVALFILILCLGFAFC